MNKFEIFMTFFNKCIHFKVTEQIVNQIIVFTANVKVFDKITNRMTVWRVL